MFKKLLVAGLGLAMTVSMMTGCSLVSDGSSSSDTKTALRTVPRQTAQQMLPKRNPRMQEAEILSKRKWLFL